MRIPGEATGRAGPALLAVGLVALFSSLNSQFFTTSNGLTIALNMSAIAIVVIGSAALLISGNVDLSIGGMYALLSVIVGQVASTTQSTTLALIVGPVAGALQRRDQRRARARAADLAADRDDRDHDGLLGLRLRAEQRGGRLRLPAGLTEIGRWGIGDLTTPIIAAVAIFMIGSFLLVRTRWGLHVYAIGGDERGGLLERCADRAGHRLAVRASTARWSAWPRSCSPRVWARWA